MKRLKNYGFRPPKIDETHYKSFGAVSLPTLIVQPNGNWASFLPKYERQFGTNWDSFGCTVFGTLNCLETMLKQKFGTDFDFAERYIYNLAEVEPPGDDPHNIAEKIRKFGVIEQKELPYVDSFEEFKKPRPMTQNFIDKGHLWLERFGFKHEWVYTKDDRLDLNKRHALIREHLQYSPLGASVTAWIQNKDLEFVSDNKDNTHWVEIFDIDEDGRVYIFDSYDQSVKLLSADHDIQFVKRYYLEEKTVEEQHKSVLKEFISLLNNYVLYLFKQVYKVGGEIVGAIFSPRN